MPRDTEELYRDDLFKQYERWCWHLKQLLAVDPDPPIALLSKLYWKCESTYRQAQIGSKL